jgi:pimeloyl-ACP methyl ester carboxylesterase
MQRNVPWLKPAIWGVVLGSVATMIVGFSWGGWTTGGTAERMAADRSTTTLVAALTPSCVASFLRQPDGAAKLAAFKKIDSSWEQRQSIEKGGWATPDGAKEPHSSLATSCAEALVKVKA